MGNVGSRQKRAYTHDNQERKFTVIFSLRGCAATKGGVQRVHFRNWDTIVLFPFPLFGKYQSNPPMVICAWFIGNIKRTVPGPAGQDI